MLVARVRVTPTPASKATVIDTLTAEATRVPAEHDGCEAFSVALDTADGSIVLVEEWATRAAFEGYTSSPEFAATMQTVAPLLAAPPDSAYYLGDRVGP